MPEHGSVINLIEGFLKEASNLDLAGDAKTTHPSADVDDKTKPATEGSRSSENEADVKKTVPNSINNEDTANTDSKGPNPGATVNGDQGMTTMDADSGLKGNVDTPKKDHSQAMSDSGPGDGSESFSGDWDKASAAGRLVGEANALLADIAMLSGMQGTAAQSRPAQKSAAASEPAATGDEAAELFKQAAEQYPEDVEAGYTAAALLAQQMGLMKEASDVNPSAETEMIEQVIKSASHDAGNYVNFLHGYAEQMQKAANPMGMDPSAMAALAGEGDAGGELGAEEMAEGAEDEDAGAGLEGLGQAEEEQGEEDEGEEEGGDDETAAIAEVLASNGIEPEELLAAIQQSAGGEEGDEAAPEAV